ncbi:uncharacterized protein LOC131956528 [Physella acuta]|uniref:uncharacterized protein LOC131956528 n=1 Tax=Physella acuta TaxID=109671 RepID=UPI0027DE9041|nr:uncharacterized protein LOC131956528 [Physella acuta]XP_059177013.1 uncharacterized protein LOC131956528 [Physella acuta]
MYQILLLVPVLLALAQSEETREEWLPDHMYNPLLEPEKCGLRPGELAYVCDPNGIIGNHIDSVNWILKDAAYNNTNCPCSNFNCEHEKGPTGYRIGLALVKRMIIQYNTDGRLNTPKDQAQLFANRLENHKWNMGRCEEDIVIFYSAEDKVLALYGGSTATAKLTPYFRELLTYKVASRFNDGRIIEGINNLLYDLKKVLNCQSTREMECGLHEMYSSASLSQLSSILLAAVAIFYTAF